VRKACFDCGQDLSDIPADEKLCHMCGTLLLLQLPGFLEQYEIIEYLHSGEQSDAFVVKKRTSGELFLAKFYPLSVDTENGEESIIAKLDHPAIPKLIESIITSDTVCIIREYARGISLDKLSYSLEEVDVLDIGLQLCDILSYLHNLTPPVIHRDIKPQNIILDDDGMLYLIDFGISRKFSTSTLKDTMSIGTEGFMPPEQYGFKQTDGRADIYSTGILLCWLVTGKTDTTQLTSLSNKKLIAVIKKCTEFAPESRYHSSDALKEALLALV